MTDRPGPTHDFPHGKPFSDDKGGINVALSSFTAPDGRKMVRIDVGTPVDWMALPTEQAIAFALTVMKFATGARDVVVTDVEKADG